MAIDFATLVNLLRLISCAVLFEPSGGIGL
jgi:hypothetical protein